MVTVTVTTGAIIIHDTPQPRQLFLDSAWRTGERAISPVRRPFGGLAVLKDTYAVLIAPSGVRNTSYRPPDNADQLPTAQLEQINREIKTANFIIQSLSHSAQQRSQVTQTFSEDRVFFFGHTVDTLQVDAMLLENQTFQWLQEWYLNYKESVSGSASTAAKLDGQVELRCEDRVYSGFVTDMSFVRNAQDRHGVQLRFTMLVAEVEFTRELSRKGLKLGGDLDAQANAYNALNARLSALRRSTVRVFNRSAAKAAAEAAEQTGTDRSAAAVAAGKAQAGARALTEAEVLALSTTEITAAFEAKPRVTEVSLREAYPTEFTTAASPTALVLQQPGADPIATLLRDKVQGPATVDREKKVKDLVDKIIDDAEKAKKATAGQEAAERKRAETPTYVSSSAIGIGARLGYLALSAGIATVAAGASAIVREATTASSAGDINGGAIRNNTEATLAAPFVDPVAQIKDYFTRANNYVNPQS